MRKRKAESGAERVVCTRSDPATDARPLTQSPAPGVEELRDDKGPAEDAPPAKDSLATCDATKIDVPPPRNLWPLIVVSGLWCERRDDLLRHMNNPTAPYFYQVQELAWFYLEVLHELFGHVTDHATLWSLYWEDELPHTQTKARVHLIYVDDHGGDTPTETLVARFQAWVKRRTDETLDVDRVRGILGPVCKLLGVVDKPISPCLVELRLVNLVAFFHELWWRAWGPAKFWGMWRRRNANQPTVLSMPRAVPGLSPSDTDILEWVVTCPDGRSETEYKSDHPATAETEWTVAWPDGPPSVKETSATALEVLAATARLYSRVTIRAGPERDQLWQEWDDTLLSHEELLELARNRTERPVLVSRDLTIRLCGETDWATVESRRTLVPALCRSVPFLPLADPPTADRLLRESDAYRLRAKLCAFLGWTDPFQPLMEYRQARASTRRSWLVVDGLEFVAQAEQRVPYDPVLCGMVAIVRDAVEKRSVVTWTLPAIQVVPSPDLVFDDEEEEEEEEEDDAYETDQGDGKRRAWSGDESGDDPFS